MNKQDILNLLTSVQTSEGVKDLTSSVKDVEVSGNRAWLEIQSASPSLQAKKQLEADILSAFKEKFPGMELKVTVKSQIPTKQVQINITPERPLKNIKNLIAVASGKGGVGKSTVTANLAVTLAKMDFKVGILDADVYGPSIPMMFDVENERPLISRKDGKDLIKPVENYGVKLLSLGFFVNPNDAVIWRGAMANKALKQLLFDADWGDLDFLLVDLPPGTGDIHLTMVQSVPLTGAVVISTPQPVALADAKKGVAMFAQPEINVPVLGIIENMSYFAPEDCDGKKYYIFGKDGAKNLSEDLQTAFLGEIPLVQSIREAGDVGRPAALQENSDLQKAFVEITQNTLTQLIKRNKEMPPTEVVRITNNSGCSAS